MDYYAVVRQAVRGNAKALKQFFGFAEDVDGGAAEGYYSDLAVVAHLVGDEKLSRFLAAQTKKLRINAAEAFKTAWELTGIADQSYFKRHFPKSTVVLD